MSNGISRIENSRDRARIHARALARWRGRLCQRLSPRFSTAAPFRQLSSTPFRLIPDAGTEKLAGVLLISGKTRQVPSRRVTVRG